MPDLRLLEASTCLKAAVLVPGAGLEALVDLDVEPLAGKSCIGVLAHVSAQALHTRERAPLGRN